ncbi:MAG: efflux RND transporter permease subunit, partial [Gammaproteobacteria bacterium]
MKNISAWAIRHPLPPIVLFVVLLFMGIVCFVRLPVTADPDISFPGVFIGVGQPGAAPQELETQVMQKVEGAVAGIGNIDNITSWAVEGQANIFIQFQIGTPIDRAVADVRDAVAKVRVLLPQGIQEPTVQRINADGGPMVLYAVSSSSLTEEELSWFVDNTITKRLLQVTGVAQVQRGGGVNREIRVELDPARMQALGITAAEVNEQLRSLNLDSPGGRAQLGGGEQAIRVLGGARTAAALGASQIALSGGRFARLSDLAEVRDGVGEVRTIARLNGRPATTFGVIKAKGYSDVSVDDGMQVELAKVRKENPQVKLTQIFTSVDYTKATYHSALSALLEGSVLAVLVVFLFLRDTRATLISALAIPLSAIPTFAFMQWMDFTLNSISLLALSLVAGVLVDDAIVEIENIVRHMRMGKSGFQAALEAADQIGLAVVATSATIIAVFVPVSFMGGLTGQYFKQFGLTVAAAVFFSLLVARLITPVVAAYTLKSDNVARHTDGPIMAWYQRLLGWCAVHRWKTVLAGFGFLALSAVGVALCSFSFIPEADVGTSFLSVELPPGVRLEDTARVTAAAYRIIARQPEVRDIVESVGTSDEGVRQAELDIALLPASERRVTQRQFEDRVTQELKVIPDAQLHFNRNGNGRDVNIYITGDDPQLTYNTA